MKVAVDIIRWLRENAYAIKGKDYWFLSDFPSEETPDRLEIPIKKRTWENINRKGYLMVGGLTMDAYDILRLQNLTYIMTQNTAAQVELQAMLAANEERREHGEAMAYGEKAMCSLIDKYQLGDNTVITNLHRGL